MRHPDEKLFTPLYVKTDPSMPWPEDEPAFYVLSRDGLFLCRNHPFFRSSVPARAWPTELAGHRESLALRYPRIPRRQIECIVGFFSRIADRHGSEAAVLLLWDRKQHRVKFHVPDQTASVSETWTGRRYPTEVRYEVPPALPGDLSVIGDVHSHVDEPAYASAMDRRDEVHRPGMHVVVGKIHREPPEFHCEVVVDGTRFEVDPRAVMEGYGKRRGEVPAEWIDRVKVEHHRPGAWSGGGWSAGKGEGNGSVREGRVVHGSGDETGPPGGPR